MFWEVMGACRARVSPTKPLLSCSRGPSTSAARWNTDFPGCGKHRHSPPSPSPPPSQDLTGPAVDAPVTAVTALHTGETERGRDGSCQAVVCHKNTPLMPPPPSSAPELRSEPWEGVF